MADRENEAEGLRQRNVSISGMSDHAARQTVLQLNALEEKTAQNDRDKKTFGRTPGGIGT